MPSVEFVTFSSFPVSVRSSHVSLSADGAGFRHPFLDSGRPTPEFGKARCAEQSGAGLCARPAPRSLGSLLQAARSRPLGSQVRPRAGRRGSCSTSATIVLPSSVIVLGRAALSRGACGPFRSP